MKNLIKLTNTFHRTRYVHKLEFISTLVRQGYEYFPSHYCNTHRAKSFKKEVSQRLMYTITAINYKYLE
jgi:hypothetical protein